ncbi:hypothetical protein FACS1894147_09220 [Spirochaetia bacterium]|nr:hypothetical protein FACS1894147_09220 [Spirochaetia bacterium]
MAKVVTDVVKNTDENGYGTITVVTTDESGRQSAATAEIDPRWSSTSEAAATEKATQESLNK